MMSPDGFSVHCAQLCSLAKFPIGDATNERTATPAKLLSQMSSMDGWKGRRAQGSASVTSPPAKAVAMFGQHYALCTPA